MAEIKIHLDVTGWDQQAKNLTEAALIALLYENNIEDRPTSVDKEAGILVFTDPLGDVAGVLTQGTLATKIAEIMASGQLTPDEILAKELEEQYHFMDAVLTALIQQLKMKNPALNVENLREDTIGQMKKNVGL